MTTAQMTGTRMTEPEMTALSMTVLQMIETGPRRHAAGRRDTPAEEPM